MSFYPELVKHLVLAYTGSNTEVTVARHITDAAGIDVGTFPSPSEYSNEREMWVLIVSIMDKQKKLHAFVQKVADTPEAVLYRETFIKIATLIAVQEQLAEFVSRSGLLPKNLRRIFMKSLSEPDDLNFNPDGSDLDTIKDLWDYEGNRKAVVKFMMLVGQEAESPKAAKDIEDWCAAAYKLEILNISQEEIDSLRQELQQPQDNTKRYLMVTIEPVEPNSTDSFTIKLYNGIGDRQPDFFASITEVTKSDLRNRIVTEIELARFSNDPWDLIEFYVPDLLLKEQIEPDQWAIAKVRLEYKVVIGISSRHEALNLLRMYRDPKSRKQLNSNPVLQKRFVEYKDLMLASDRWEKHWKQLNTSLEKAISDVVRRLERDEVERDGKDLLEDLLQMLTHGEATWVTFAFSPSNLESCLFEKLLNYTVLAGMPAILWPHGPEFSSRDVLEVQHILEKYVFDHIQNKTIGNAADIIELVHQIRLNALKNAADPNHVGRHLAFILDNPERKFPPLMQTSK